MKTNCRGCGCLVADIKEGSMIRKGAVMLCASCAKRWKTALDVAEMARTAGPGFLEGLLRKT